MKKYVENVKALLSEEITGVEEYNVGDPIAWFPQEETEVTDCYLESIREESGSYVVVLRVENEENGSKYLKEYIVQKGTKLEMNTFEMPFMCFLPPDIVPVLAEIVDISLNGLKIQTVGVEESWATQDK